MQDQKTVNLQPSPTVTPNENSLNKQEFDKHYWEGIRIRNNGKFPDDMPQAIDEFKKAAEIDSKNTTSYWMMVEIFTSLKKYDEVEAGYRKILERSPEDLRAQWGLAQVLVEDSKKYEEGLKEALIAKEKKATYPFLIEKVIGKAYEGLGDIPSAIEHYKIYRKGYKTFTSNDDKEIETKIMELEKISHNSNTQN